MSSLWRQIFNNNHILIRPGVTEDGPDHLTNIIARQAHDSQTPTLAKDHFLNTDRLFKAIPVGAGGRLYKDTNFGYRKSFLPQVFEPFLKPKTVCYTLQEKLVLVTSGISSLTAKSRHKSYLVTKTGVVSSFKSGITGSTLSLLPDP